mmetsp:Transcript_62888/g.99834  ORF Transcript_62888/g.99834 Transcript_62888/m.99834 type:complete len:255 (-) Transcript_62888:769-1533(-)
MNELLHRPAALLAVPLLQHHALHPLANHIKLMDHLQQIGRALLFVLLLPGLAAHLSLRNALKQLKVHQSELLCNGLRRRRHRVVVLGDIRTRPLFASVDHLLLFLLNLPLCRCRRKRRLNAHQQLKVSVAEIDKLVVLELLEEGLDLVQHHLVALEVDVKVLLNPRLHHLDATDSRVHVSQMHVADAVQQDAQHGLGIRKRVVLQQEHVLNDGVFERRDLFAVGHLLDQLLDRRLFLGHFVHLFLVVTFGVCWR